MLQIIFPFSLVHSSVDVPVSARAICFIVGPESIINVSIYMYKFPLSMGPIFFPFTNVSCAIWPVLLPKTVTEPAFPFAAVNCLSFERIWRAGFARLIWLIEALGHSFARFFYSKILAGANFPGAEHADDSAGGVTSPPGLHFDDVLNFAGKERVVTRLIKTSRIVIAPILSTCGCGLLVDLVCKCITSGLRIEAFLLLSLTLQEQNRKDKRMNHIEWTV